MILASSHFTRAVLGTALLALAACSDNAQEATPQAAGAQEQTETTEARVATLTVRPRRVVVYDELPGRVAALRTAEIRPQVSGIVRKVLFKEGSEVSAEQPLFEIDPAPFAADVEAASAVLARAEADELNASLKHDRIKALAESRTATAAALGDAKAALAQSRASVAEARANLTRRKLELAHATVTSPIAGRIGQALITEGGLATAGATNPMAVVQQLDRLFLDVRQPSMRREMLEEAVANGQGDEAGRMPVDILTITGKPYEYQGTIRFSDSAVDPGTGSITIRVEVPNPYDQLLPGMYLRARLPRSVHPNALTVPQEAVVRDSSGRPQLMVVGADRTASRRNVELGPLVERQYVILSGIGAGDEIVVRGQDRATDGTRLQTVAYQPAVGTDAK
ncbi:efflux RND transporter periplasmic adaptor subunit [Prosthecomicrobium pneumaticum]|uniref:Multidrug efflux system membrane fusion protein n=1 Tax=Prosthecomicrobium pneumaticum TaxID=81895 RepID=A0A7W9L1Y0_9HYPH|nr:efflux RND transporter periplasmic adaptor subunit [Prosthecomicrobium pneumaticum]MBB5753038.1 multidrug efflux system membrane fusion protein [Prosthecomicrobium pneumaticum]